MSTEQPEQKVEPAKRPSPSEMAWGAFFLFFIVICTIGSVKSCNGSDEPIDKTIAAESICEEFINDRLKAPATAEYNHNSTTFDDPAYTVVGTVDSENSFGAMIRSTYTCTVTPVGDSEWHLDSLNIH